MIIEVPDIIKLEMEQIHEITRTLLEGDPSIGDYQVAINEVDRLSQLALKNLASAEKTWISVNGRKLGSPLRRTIKRQHK